MDFFTRGLKRKNNEWERTFRQGSSSKHPRQRTSSTEGTHKLSRGIQTSQNHSSILASDPCATYIKDPTYFFDDADIILRVTGTLFRVHRNKLQALGGIFEQLLSLPQPEDADVIDGVGVCDLYYLVSTGDIRFLLAFTYGDLVLKQMVVNGPDHLHWYAAMALLDVSYKLDLPGVRHSALEALELLFPSGRNIQTFKPAIQGISTEKDRQLFLRLFPLQAINLFRLHNISALMPLAYYHAAQLSINDIVNGVVRGDGGKETICAFDIARILEGREYLKASRRTTVFGWLNTLTSDGKVQRLNNDCENSPLRSGDTCFYYLLRLLMYFNRTGFLDMRTDGLEPLPEASDAIFEKHLCEICWSTVQEKLRCGLQRNWEAIPKYFGFTSWENVMKVQASQDTAWEN